MELELIMIAGCHHERRLRLFGDLAVVHSQPGLHIPARRLTTLPVPGSCPVLSCPQAGCPPSLSFSFTASFLRPGSPPRLARSLGADDGPRGSCSGSLEVEEASGSERWQAHTTRRVCAARRLLLDH
eukprot:2000429-Rhodomonas_salina.1